MDLSWDKSRNLRDSETPGENSGRKSPPRSSTRIPRVVRESSHPEAIYGRLGSRVLGADRWENFFPSRALPKPRVRCRQIRQNNNKLKLREAKMIPLGATPSASALAPGFVLAWDFSPLLASLRVSTPSKGPLFLATGGDDIFLLARSFVTEGICRADPSLRCGRLTKWRNRRDSETPEISLGWHDLGPSRSHQSQS